MLNTAFNELHTANCLVWNSRYVYFPNQLRHLHPTQDHSTVSPTSCNMPKQIAYSAFKLHTHTHTKYGNILSVCVSVPVYLCTTYGIFKIFFVRNFFRFVFLFSWGFGFVFSCALAVCVCVCVYTWIILRVEIEAVFDWQSVPAHAYRYVYYRSVYIYDSTGPCGY